MLSFSALDILEFTPDILRKDLRRSELLNTREKLNSMCDYFQVGFRLYGSVVSTTLVG